MRKCLERIVCATSRLRPLIDLRKSQKEDVSEKLQRPEYKVPLQRAFASNSLVVVSGLAILQEPGRAVALYLEEGPALQSIHWQFCLSST